jgi:hypothetical protein
LIDTRPNARIGRRRQFLLIFYKGNNLDIGQIGKKNSIQQYMRYIQLIPF